MPIKFDRSSHNIAEQVKIFMALKYLVARKVLCKVQNDNII